MKHGRYISMLLCICLFILQGARGQQTQSIDFVFYNVENLFDVKDDPGTNDEEFLPDGVKRWTYDRYQTKVDHIARVLVGIGKWELPALIGLCEVENAHVLYELAGHRLLEEADYTIIHRDSPDRRGIDVALVYDPDVFTPLFRKWIGINFMQDPDILTREILYVKGLAMNDTLHIFINHWPSRWGGVEASMPRRLHVAGILKWHCDSILSNNRNASILIGGDFNDTPADSSIFSVLGAGPHTTCDKHELINLMYPLHTSGQQGTLKYRENWEIYDQIIVSANMLVSDKVQIAGAEAFIYNAGYLLEDDERYLGKKPFRTYSGPRYHGGFSDHLPVYVRLVMMQEPEGTGH
ncbi:MAG: hypothetical protein RQ761_11575 [Bacteroidales bacterium]|nr:hypothetical protein [Bacteroidales bacterium]